MSWPVRYSALLASCRQQLLSPAACGAFPWTARLLPLSTRLGAALHTTTSTTSTSWCVLKSWYPALTRSKHSDRGRRKHKSNSYDSDSEDDSSDDDDGDDGGTDGQVKRVKLKSVRVDSVLPFALGLSRKKFEAAFYNSRVFLNGRRLEKKSQNVFEGDQVDLVRGCNAQNSQLIDIARLQVLAIDNVTSEGATLKLKVFKHVLTDDYRDVCPPASDV